jgi:hypothetical protein
MESSTRIQDFALSKVYCRQTMENPPSPTKEFVPVSPPQDSLLPFCQECESQVPAQRFKDSEYKKGTLTIWPPIPHVPPINLREKRDTKQIKVELPDGTTSRYLPLVKDQ